MASDELTKLDDRAERYCSREKHGGEQLITQVIIEWKFGTDLVSLCTNGINHSPCQKGCGSPPILEDQKHRIGDETTGFFFITVGVWRGNYTPNNMICEL